MTQKEGKTRESKSSHAQSGADQRGRVSAPVVCPADVPQCLQVFLTDDVRRVAGDVRTAALLFPPLALCKHALRVTKYKRKERTKEPRRRELRSTPTLLQGGEVGQQALMVEFLQLQKVQGPLVCKREQLKTTSHRVESLSVN